MERSFTILKVKDHDGDMKKPTHKMSMKIAQDAFTFVGSCWTKEGKSGKYLSCSFDKPYKDKLGYVIQAEKGENQDVQI